MALELKDEASRSIVDFLKTHVSKTNAPNIETELKKDFLLAKKRSKEQRQKRKKKESKLLTRKEKKALGFFDIPRNSVQYSTMVPINQVWSEYIAEILELDKPVPQSSSKGWDQFTLSLYKADFHGSMLQVIRSKCPSYVGKKGICVMDTRNTFKIVSPDNIVTTIPKKDCVFEMYVKDLKICVFGKHLCVRPAERSTKKLKCHLHPDL